MDANQSIEIGERIKKARMDKGLTLQQLADQLGLTQATVSKYETVDIKNIPVSRIIDIANVLQISPSYLQGFDDKPVDCMDRSEEPIQYSQKKITPDVMEEELVRKRITILQSSKEDLAEKINPMLGKRTKTLDLYKELNSFLNKIILEEAKYLVEISK